MRTLVLVGALAALSGCQCFVPVDDEPDGGSDAGTPRPDAGRDAGLDAGSDAGFDAGSDAGSEVDAGRPLDAGCARASQCTSGPQPTTNWCNGSQPDAGYSCIANTCLWECPVSSAGRTCIVDMGSYCLRCGDDAGTACPRSGTTACGAPATMGSAMVESGSTCVTWPGSSVLFTDVTIMRTASAQCRYMVTGAGQTLGEFWRLDDGEYLAYFPGFGGWCTGRSAFTGVPRGIFNCPSCQFVLAGFE
jgi:hypothetical protein